MVDTSVANIELTKEGKMEGNIVKVNGHKHRIDELQMQVDKIEKRVNDVQQFYWTTSKNHLSTVKDHPARKDKDKDKHIPGMKKQQQDASRRDAAGAKRMQELMRQFGTIFRQITQHKYAWPFMQPVDVKGLGLHDYYEVIDRPMDFSTIKNQMEAMDGAGYKHVREIYADMLLVFNNAMKYNDETSDVHSMAKTLLEKFEEKWLQLLPKVTEEDKRREEEKVEAQLKKQLAQEAARAELARDLTNELNEANKQLEELGGILGKKCRKLSIKDKRGIGISLAQLCPEDLAKALEIVSQDKPTFQATGEEVELDISAQSEFTLWRLKFFLRDALGSQRNSSSNGGKNTTKSCHAAVSNTSAIASKRKRDICNALAKTAKKRENSRPSSEGASKIGSEDIELPLFEFEGVAKATSDFSHHNKLGHGGYGPVYKGMLDDGREIAVKRLSSNSGQGLDEFKNEVSFIAKLQHRNLVTLLGCCIEKGERILIYEYMANKSLDSFISDEKIKNTMDWQKRYNIINGIARGLLYLHEDSKLRIIHRDLKASNILLDHEMNPKISDFGMARSFGANETEAKTARVVGTYGYMSPEYAIDGQFSVKSDVYSFGVLLIEIITGKKNRYFCHPDHSLNLLGHAWKCYNEDKLLLLLDDMILESCNQREALRLIQIGLLCVQNDPKDRPAMSQVVFMLSSNMKLPQPKQPGFFMERFLFESDHSLTNPTASPSELTITALLPRE